MSRRAVLVATAVALLLAASALAGHPASRAAVAPACATPGRTVLRLRSGGRLRRAIVRVPAGVGAAAGAPLVVVLHGYHGNGAQMERYSGFDPLADRGRFLVAYPTSAGTYWNSDATAALPDDVAFIDALIARLRGLRCVDPQRVFLAGVSNGGGMAALAACRLSGELAGFASVAGGYDGQPPCHPRRPLSLLEIHGTADQIAPYDGARAFVAGWRRRDSCSGTATTSRLTRRAVRRRWSGCLGATTVEQIVITGGRHQWPGASPPDPGPRAGFSAAAEISAFFAGVAVRPALP